MRRKQVGRRRRAGERARLAAEYLKGGMDLAAFARQQGVGEATVRRWVEESGRGRAGAPRLVPVVPASAAGGETEAIEIALADGTSLRVPLSMDPGRLAAVVAALRLPC